jgi:hypothetical protein
MLSEAARITHSVGEHPALSFYGLFNFSVVLFLQNDRICKLKGQSKTLASTAFDAVPHRSACHLL